MLDTYTYNEETADLVVTEVCQVLNQAELTLMNDAFIKGAQDLYALNNRCHDTSKLESTLLYVYALRMWCKDESYLNEENLRNILTVINTSKPCCNV